MFPTSYPEKVEISISSATFSEAAGVFEAVLTSVVSMVDVGILHSWVLVGKGYNQMNS